MYTTNLRKVSGSVMFAVPPALLDLLGLRPGTSVDITVVDGRLVVTPRTRPRYSLEELLAQCEDETQGGDANRAWLEAGPVGSELL